MDVNQYVVDNAEPGVFLDIGANHGMYTRRMAQRGTTVYAFEPAPANLVYLEQACSSFDNVVIVDMALSNTKGKLKLFSCPNPGGYSISNVVAEVRTWGHSPDVYEEVDTITLDEYCSTNNITGITGIKIDVEGAEQFVLEGAQETLRSNSPLIALETHQTIDRKRVYELIADHGYEIQLYGTQTVKELDYDRAYVCKKR